MKIHHTTENLPENVTVWVLAQTHDFEDFGIISGIWDGERLRTNLGTKGKVRDPYSNDIILWSATPFEDKPLYEALLALLASDKHCWFDTDHMIEDWMHRMALRLVVAGAENAKEIAALALRTRDLDFTRYYS